MFHLPSIELTPGRTIVLSLLGTISIGVALLSLPFAHKTSVAFLDVLFTAVSSTCGTGLLTVPLQSFSLFGQFIILALIQIGGLGIITLSLFLVSFFIDIGLGTQFLAGRMFEIEGTRPVRRLIKFIVLCTLSIEALGAFCIWLSVPAGHTQGHPLFYAWFHAISSFCNAGISTFPFELDIFRNNLALLFVTSLLVTIGGLGFISLRELITRYDPLHHDRRLHLSLNTKVILTTTLCIIAVGFVLLWVLERTHSFSGAPTLTAAVNMLFNVTCGRSAGFTTFDMPLIRSSTLFVIIVLCFIGSSPGSTGSGIKTTTFALLLATIRTVITGRRTVELKKRTIPNEHVFKALSILALSLTWIALGFFVLLISEEKWGFSDIMFEAFSAFANMGLSTGLTPYLSKVGKFVIILLMIIGRIGSLTLILALKRRKESPADIRYPEERIALS